MYAKYIYKVNKEKKYSGLLLKGLKKSVTPSKIFFLSFYQNTNFRKKIKSAFKIFKQGS